MEGRGKQGLSWTLTGPLNHLVCTCVFKRLIWWHQRIIIA